MENCYIVTIRYFDVQINKIMVKRTTVHNYRGPAYARDCAWKLMKKRGEVLDIHNVIDIKVVPAEYEVCYYTKDDLEDYFNEDLDVDDVISETYVI